MKRRRFFLFFGLFFSLSVSFFAGERGWNRRFHTSTSYSEARNLAISEYNSYNHQNHLHFLSKPNWQNFDLARSRFQKLIPSRRGYRPTTRLYTDRTHYTYR